MIFTLAGIDTFVDLINNAVLLFALGFIYGATNFKPKEVEPFKKIILGLVIGGFAMLVMMTPWYASEGLIYDTRSVLLSVTGLFFGGLTTSIAVVIAAIYRIFIGGIGVYAGVLTIFSTALLGLSWKHIRKRFSKLPPWLEYYLFGVVVHIITLLCQLAIPWPGAFTTIQNIALPFLGLFPLLTMILAIAVRNQHDRLNSHQELEENRLLLQSSIDSTKTMEIYALDLQFNYKAFNKFHHDSMMKYYDVDITLHSNFLSYIDDEHMHYRLKSYFDKAILGEAFTRIIEVETEKGKYLEEYYSPIRTEDGEVIGITVFSEEVTERKKYEESILYLSYHDSLTGLFNRRYYTEELAKLDNKENYPLSIIMADINGLKITNDAFGHDAGDVLLKTVSNELKSVFQKYAEVARIGGDEFVVLLKNSSKQTAMNLIDTAKRRIEKNIFHGMSVSVSFGCETQDGKLPTSEIIKLAEDDMYKHKLFEVTSNRNESIKTILHTLHVKSPREEVHSKRVSEFCVMIGKALGMRNDEIDLLKIIGNLHDIGKIAIDDSILNKPGSLTLEEWAAIKRHPEIGYRILSSSPEFTEISLDILSHHERYDGTGYPQGIAGKAIPIRARIISIADAFDAMTSSRPYRGAFSKEEALEELAKCSGTQFDPFIAKLFIDEIKKLKAD